MRIFVSYQRADTAFAAHGLKYALQLAGHEVFIDTGDIAAGEAFRDVIRAALERSDLVLALLGPGFDCSRLHDPLNAVAYEWRQARFSGCATNPLLVDGARMPHEDELPADLRWLPRLSAAILDRNNLSHGMEELVASIPQLAARPRGARRVLWVDDNPANNERERSALRPGGIAFDNVVSTREAIEQLRTSSYDLVITDLGRQWSSDRSGEAGAELLADPVIRKGGPPVLIYAGRRAVSREADLLASGASGVAGSRERLYELVHEYIGVRPSGSAAVDAGRSHGTGRTPGSSAPGRRFSALRHLARWRTWRPRRPL
jgi:CheY-like chemotaxis protein